jgi:hypothetical protein
MLARGIVLEDVVDTIAKTLPVCRQRKIAYATLQILMVDPSGFATLVEFDSPRTLLARGNKVVPFPAHERIVAGKPVLTGQFQMQENDWIVLFSDGIVHAGIDGLIPLGWGWNGVSKYVESELPKLNDTNALCQAVLGCCEGYFLGKPGDDCTVAAVRLRRPRRLSLMIGPPSDPENDAAVADRFLRMPKPLVVSGGTTATILSRHLNKPLMVDLEYHDPNVPPTGSLEGIDLVTEGVLTVNACVDRLRDPEAARTASRRDGATRLAKLLLETDHVHILAGGAVNAAHQNPLLPAAMNIKMQVLSRLQAELERLGKIVQIEWT